MVWGRLLDLINWMGYVVEFVPPQSAEMEVWDSVGNNQYLIAAAVFVVDVEYNWLG